MKYRLINSVTKTETICDKVVIDYFDYYISDGFPKHKEWFYIPFCDRIEQYNETANYGEFHPHKMLWKVIIATNKHSIDIPKIVDEIWEKAWEIAKQTNIKDEQQLLYMATAWHDGYHSSKETHPFSKADVLDIIQSLKDYTHESHKVLGHDEREPEEFLQIWKEEQLETLYYVD